MKKEIALTSSAKSANIDGENFKWGIREGS